MQERVIVQIAGDNYVVALCNDGTAFRLKIDGETWRRLWIQLPEIPQPEKPEKTE
jgi:hypothetical protein